LFYVFTGKTNTNKVQNQNLKEFVSTGMNSDKNKRFSSIHELAKAFNNLFEQET